MAPSLPEHRFHVDWVGDDLNLIGAAEPVADHDLSRRVRDREPTHPSKRESKDRTKPAPPGSRHRIMYPNRDRDAGEKAGQSRQVETARSIGVNGQEPATMSENPAGDPKRRRNSAPAAAVGKREVLLAKASLANMSQKGAVLRRSQHPTKPRA